MHANALARLSALRALLKSHALDGFVLPRTDEYQGENIAPYAQRLAWLTGFTGSAGAAVILPDKAALFVDGRYTLQAASQIDQRLYALHHIPDTRPSDWLQKEGVEGQRIGFDPWLLTRTAFKSLQKACASRGVTLVEITPNPIDQLWTDQPARPQSPIHLHPLVYAGERAREKSARLAAFLAEHAIEAAVLTALDSIAWIANIRGDDIPYAPLVFAAALLNADGRLSLFLEKTRINANLTAALEKENTQLLPMSAFEDALEELGRKSARVLIDPALTPVRILSILEAAGAILVEGADPCLLPKACKNATEIEGMRQAHIRDGAAVVHFLSWLDEAWKNETVTEQSAAEKLLACRAVQSHFKGLSFPTISAAGSHGAIIHYKPTAATDAPLEAGQLYLVDSGGQYIDGTTDITRTLALGEPSSEQCDRFTRVLKGHIALASALFPKGTTGLQLDILTRAPLWRIGVDFDHGAGHGVGSYLCVHEGPQYIGKSERLPVALQPGMILSNEPGYYKEGAYGIRLENLIVVKEASLPQTEAPMLCFETLTMAPFCLDLINPSLLNPEEIKWLNVYHRTVYQTLRPYLDEKAKTWLSHACRPLKED